MTLEDNCKTRVWIIAIDKKGNKISDTVEEEIKEDHKNVPLWNK